MTRRFGVLAALFTIGLVVSGCVPGAPVPTTSRWTLEEAKTRTLGMEQEIAALVPAEAKGHIDQNNTGPLLSCRREGDYSWTGRTVVALLQPVDIDALLDAVRNHFLGRIDYVAEDRPFHDGRPRTSIRGADGESYFVHMSHDSQRLEINSFSPCFALSQGLWPGGIY